MLAAYLNGVSAVASVWPLAHQIIQDFSVPTLCVLAAMHDRIRHYNYRAPLSWRCVWTHSFY